MQELKEYWKNEMKNYPGGTFIISGENLSRLNTSATRELKKFVNNYFMDIKIIIYVRDPLSYINSVVQQKIKSGKQTIESININQVELYRGCIEIYMNIFGKEALIVRPFIREAFVNNNLIEDFISSIGLNSNIASKLKVTSKNNSLGEYSVQTLSRFNKKYPLIKNSKINSERGLARNKGVLINVLSKIEEPSFKFKYKISKEFARMLNDEIEFVNKLIPVEHRFTEISAENEDLSENVLGGNVPIEFYIEIINELAKTIEKHLKNK